MTGDEERETRVTDFRMAGYLASRGARLLRAEVSVERTDQVEFVFDASAEGLLCGWPGSTEEKYDTSCRSMQTILRTVLRSRRAG